MTSVISGSRSFPVRQTGTLWAITTYFNPLGYARRLDAYRVFSQALRAPLLTVELGFDNRFYLQRDDADILLRISGRDVMWQKERLLNLALSALPETCDMVAWLDCDILFDQDDWPRRVEALLARHPLAQLYQNVHYLDPAWQSGSSLAAHRINSRSSLASGAASGRDVDACLAHPSPQQRPGTYANGMAWAARRELLDRFGFYDACIIGGGDRAISSAAFGCFEHVRNWHEFNDRQWTYYLEWAEPFHDACRGSVGVLQGDIHHQWHGKASDRGLGTRHGGLRKFDFDPARDIAIDSQGCWAWNSEKPELHAYVREYFRSRREDG